MNKTLLAILGATALIGDVGVPQPTVTGTPFRKHRGGKLMPKNTYQKRKRKLRQQKKSRSINRRQRVS